VSTSRYLKPADVAALLNVSKPTVMALARTKGLPMVELGPRVYRFERTAVEAWIEQHRHQQRKAG
jgi:excisionase family DNA binding protein